jgi:hypothetical protein
MNRKLSGSSVLISLHLLLGMVVMFNCRANAQSTFGTFLGTVTDPSGQVLTDATATLTNTGTGATTTAKTDKEGTYSFLNVEPGTYSISISSEGFQQKEYSNLVLQARDTQRIDVKLTVGSTVSTVLVQATAAVINTDVSNLAETRTGIELN